MGVKPRIITSYDGGDIVLNTKKNMVLSPAVFPDMLLHKGEDFIVADGTTLLGADDKAGIAQNRGYKLKQNGSKKPAEADFAKT